MRIEVLDQRGIARLIRSFLRDVEWFIQNRPDLVGDACYAVEDGDKRYVLSIADPNQFKRLAAAHLGSRRISLAVWHSQPIEVSPAIILSVRRPRRWVTKPGEAEVKLKGGNSNWRGPVWFPTSYLLIHSFLRFRDALGAQFSVQVPGGDGKPVTPSMVAEETANRMISIFKRDQDGKRPCFGAYRQFQDDPHWRDCLLFNEYYHGDTGMGLGASHQTGWTGLVANLIDEWRR